MHSQMHNIYHILYFNLLLEGSMRGSGMICALCMSLPFSEGFYSGYMRTARVKS